MTAVACTLVSLCVSLILVSGLPAAKRLPLSHDSDDVLAGSDFLSMFMQRGDRPRTADRPGPHQYDRDLNSVSHKGVLDLVKPYSDKYTISNIFKTAKYGYAVEEPTDEEEYQITTPDVIPTFEADVRTTTQLNEPTTTEDAPTTPVYAFDKTADNIYIEEVHPTVTSNEETATKTESVTEQVATEKFEEKVISVRVSSSVARHSHRTIETSTTKSTSEVVSQPKHVDENLVSTLVTQEQPTITAVQRSEFAVEEASLSGSEDHHEAKDQRPYERQEEVEGKVQEVSLYSDQQQRGLNGKGPVFEIHFHNPPEALLSNYGSKTDGQASTGRRKEFRQLSHYGSHGHTEPVSYHSRVSSPTSDSSVKYYRDHSRSSAPSAAETINQPVITDPYVSAPYPQSQKQVQDPPGELKYKETAVYHEEPRERTYGEPEKVYGQPEVNYEVDEAVSVITNGKAHGAQVPTPSPPADPSGQNKFGYVVEGRNFRKYRVEERTADGFIVGEYGVVSHDDGSLRGVRYTADSTINPRLIYDTLVKFLSLK